MKTIVKIKNIVYFIDSKRSPKILLNKDFFNRQTTLNMLNFDIQRQFIPFNDFNFLIDI